MRVAIRARVQTRVARPMRVARLMRIAHSYARFALRVHRGTVQCAPVPVRGGIRSKRERRENFVSHLKDKERSALARFSFLCLLVDPKIFAPRGPDPPPYLLTLTRVRF